MKLFKTVIEDGVKRIEDVIVTWSDHLEVCKRCRDVEIEKSATFVKACVLGSNLLLEELAKRAAPAIKAKQEEVREQAEKAGVFKMGRAKNVHMKYVGDE